MKLFLDDIRNPPDDSWSVVRSVAAFKSWIETNGVPEIISFDHDLGGELSGYDCAKWLVENELQIGDFRVHSANPVGAENIRCLLLNWQRHCQGH